MKYPFVRPVLPRVGDWDERLQVAYSKRYFTNFGQLNNQFEELLAARFGAGDASVTLASNATIGLSAALIGLGVRGKVVLPAFTFPATLHAILAARCEPLLCDVDPETCELCPVALSALLAQHDVAAVMPVRVYGFVRDLSPVIRLARLHGVPVVVDAAAALGVCAIDVADDVVEVVSLHATKSFGIGEGGAIFAAPRHRAAMRSALNFGLRPDRSFGFGLNGKMTELQAAIGLAQAEQIDAQLQARRGMVREYQRRLSVIPELTYPVDPGATPWSVFPIILPRDVDAGALEKRCHEGGLFVRRYYWPSLSTFDDLPAPSATPVADDLALRAICLPVYSDCRPEEQDEMLAIFEDAYEAASATIA